MAMHCTDGKMQTEQHVSTGRSPAVLSVVFFHVKVFTSVKGSNTEGRGRVTSKEETVQYEAKEYKNQQRKLKSSGVAHQNLQ